MNKMSMEHWWNDAQRGKPQVLGEKTRPGATLSDANPTCAGLKTISELRVDNET